MSTQQAEAAMREESKANEEIAEVRVHDDHTRSLKTPGFSRMRTDWHGEDAVQIAYLRNIADSHILTLFPDAFVLMNDLWEIVRAPLLNDDQVPYKDPNGFTIWARTDSGAFIEDYSRLGLREREDLLFRITTNIFEWRQTQANIWGDAMFSKALWEEAFSTGFTEPTGRLTVDDRTNRARVYATDQRYFSIFQSLLSKKADAVVESVGLLAQRLKDVLTM